MTGPKSQDVSAWPGAPGVPGGGDSAPAPPIKTGAIGRNGLGGGTTSVPIEQAFPGYSGDTWQQYQDHDPEINPSTMTNTPSVDAGIDVSHPDAFYPGLGQGV